jgi:hypothetical protein
MITTISAADAEPRRKIDFLSCEFKNDSGGPCMAKSTSSSRFTVVDGGMANDSGKYTTEKPKWETTPASRDGNLRQLIPARVLSLLQKYEIYASRIVERIESLKIVSRSQFNQGKTLAAEKTKAIQMIVDQWGIQHSWVPEFMNVLEGWLRGWGREEDANTLRGEIEALMGKDEIDE